MPDALVLPFECPNCGADHEFDVERQALADRNHPWSDYKVSTSSCDDCGENVTLELRGLVENFPREER